eukprot:5077186-Prorocentrum_lima.AAC.1
MGQVVGLIYLLVGNIYNNIWPKICKEMGFFMEKVLRLINRLVGNINNSMVCRKYRRWDRGKMLVKFPHKVVEMWV